MAGALQALAETAYRVVETGPMEWRIRRVRSRDLAVNGHGHLLALLTVEDFAEMMGAAKRGETPDFRAKSAELMARLGNLPDTAKVRRANAQDALVCAGVVAGRDPKAGAEWEPVEVSSSKTTSEDGSVLNVCDLPEPWRAQLSTEIQDHSGSEEGLADALASFRSGAATDDG